jgi:hypothetical protein
MNDLLSYIKKIFLNIKYKIIIMNEDNNINEEEYIQEFVFNNNLYDINDVNTINAIQNFINNITNNNNILNIENNIIDDTIDKDNLEICIEITYIENESMYNEYFKSCKEINDKISIPKKIKKDDPLLVEGNCLICMENYKFGEFKRELPKCNHVYHKKCIDKWLKKKATCPICRDKLL